MEFYRFPTNRAFYFPNRGLLVAAQVDVLLRLSYRSSSFEVMFSFLCGLIKNRKENRLILKQFDSSI